MEGDCISGLARRFCYLSLSRIGVNAREFRGSEWYHHGGVRTCPKPGGPNQSFWKKKRINASVHSLPGGGRYLTPCWRTRSLCGWPDAGFRTVFPRASTVRALIPVDQESTLTHNVVHRICFLSTKKKNTCAWGSLTTAPPCFGYGIRYTAAYRAASPTKDPKNYLSKDVMGHWWPLKWKSELWKMVIWSKQLGRGYDIMWCPTSIIAISEYLGSLILRLRVRMNVNLFSLYKCVHDESRKKLLLF